MEPNTLIDPTLTSLLVSFATAVATKGATAPAHTLDLIWKVTLGRWDPKLENMVKKQMEKYAHDITDEVNKIPPDKINPEPDINIIGPAFEASKYYVSEETIRKMFARLIAASLDMRKKDTIHHAFVEIIRQMSPLDAQILSELSNPFGLLYYTFPRSECSDSFSIISDIYLSDTFPEYNKNVSISIGNLARLGLIDIPSRNMGGIRMEGAFHEHIDHFKKTTLYTDTEKLLANINNQKNKSEVVTYPAYLTQLSFAFRSICLETP